LGRRCIKLCGELEKLNKSMEKTNVDNLYTRINLEKTNYDICLPMAILLKPDSAQIRNIYYSYCKYKKFKSCPIIHDAEILGKDIEVLGYYDQGYLVAFSLIRKFDKENIENFQFAWNYHNPKARFGIRSLQSEIAYYKENGYKYYYLGLDAPYKRKLQGFEILGPIE